MRSSDSRLCFFSGSLEKENVEENEKEWEGIGSREQGGRTVVISDFCARLTALELN